MNKKNITQINWDEVDAVPETEYNYNDAPEICAEMFKVMTVIQLANKKAIPFEIIEPNDVSVRSIAKSNAGEDVYVAKDSLDLFKKLGI